MKRMILVPMVFALVATSLFAQTPTPTPCIRCDASTPCPTASPRGEQFATAGGQDQVPLKWDVYLPNPDIHPTPWPVVVLIHGGGFAGGTRDESQIPCAGHDLADAGFAAVSIDYRVDNPAFFLTGQTHRAFYPPSAPYDQISDVQKAIEAARHPELIPPPGSVLSGKVNGKVGAIGGSAGGSHAVWWAAAGTGDDKLDAAVSLSGIYAMDDGDSLTDQNYPNFCPPVKAYCTVASTFPCDMLSGNNKLHTGSPIYQVTSSVAPLFIIDAFHDGGTPPEQKMLLNNLLNSLGVDHDCAQVGPGAPGNNCNHAFQLWCDRAVDCDDSSVFRGNVNDLAISFLQCHLQGICP